MNTRSVDDELFNKGGLCDQLLAIANKASCDRAAILALMAVAASKAWDVKMTIGDFRRIAEEHITTLYVDNPGFDRITTETRQQ